MQFLPPSAPATQHAYCPVPPFLLFFPRFFLPSGSLPSSEANEADANLRAFGVSIMVSKFVSPDIKRLPTPDPIKSLD